jgi:hypothetical protein
MLQFINDLPSYVVGIKAVGEVEKDDYERVLIPRLDELAKRQGEINYLLVLETDVQNFSVAAWWEDFKLALKHFTKWNKIAIVTDQKGVEWFSDVFRLFIPGKSRGFELKELGEAIQWISAKGDDEHPEPAEPLSDNDGSEVSLANSSNKGQGPSGENL